MLKTAQNSGLEHATYSFVFFGFLLVMFSVNFDVCSIAFVMHFLNGVTFQFCSSTWLLQPLSLDGFSNECYNFFVPFFWIIIFFYKMQTN